MVIRKELLKYKTLMVKSNYIIEASYKLTLQEQRIIYILTSKIEKDDMEFKPCKFTQSEISNIIKKHKITFGELTQNIDSLRNRELVIIKENSILKTKWLSSAEYFEDGSIELCFDNKLKPYLLQLKERFTKLDLSNVINFSSNYSCRIYELLKQYESIGERKISVADLKTMFCIEPEEYKRYNDFKRKVILQAQKEINGKTDINFEFEEIKTGRKINDLKFIIKTNMWKQKLEAPGDNTADPDALEKVKSIIHEDITDLEAASILQAAKDNVNIIKEKYEIAKVTSNITSIVPWIKDAIKNDYQMPKGKSNKTFSQYEQRSYDFDKLEKQLLGYEEIAIE